MSKLTSPLVWGGVAAALALTVMITAAERTRRDVHRSIDAVNHTLDVQKAFNLVLKDMLDAETGQRGFLLTGSASYLPPYRQAQRAMANHLDSLETLTVSDAHHRERVGQIPALVREKMQELSDTIRLAERGQRDAAVTVVATDRGRLLMERARCSIRPLSTSRKCSGNSSPGVKAPGDLYVGDVQMSPSHTLVVEVNGVTPGLEYDRLIASSSVSLNGANLMLVPGAPMPQGSTFTIVTNASGTFAGLPDGATILTAFGKFRIAYTGGPAQTDVVLIALII
jgi:CHASE3 domain sensor protein